MLLNSGGFVPERQKTTLYGTEFVLAEKEVKFLSTCLIVVLYYTLIYMYLNGRAA